MRTASPPFFIVGSGRSGSTLLRMILASHSRITIPPETWYLLPLIEQFSLDQPLDAPAVERVVGIMTGHYRWQDMALEASALRRQAAELDAPTLKEIVEIVYAKYMMMEGKPRWGDKTPGYVKIVPQLAELFPDAKFIHLLRDGRDVAKSFQSVGWYGPLLYKNTREWSEALDHHARLRDSPLTERLLTVRYEDLVSATEATVREICEFLGEQFEPRMLAWEGHVTRLVPSREMLIHGKLGRRPGLADVERWRREMTTGEVFVAEAFMGRHLARAGYTLRYKGPLWRPALACARLYCRGVLPIVAFQARALRRVHRILTARRKVERSSGARCQTNS